MMKTTMACALVLGAGLVSGCTALQVEPVQPWQRGDLARPEMALEVDPVLSGFRQHVEVSKEAARGGAALAGGGCGCN